MTQADSVHSTPRINSLSGTEPNLDLAYRRLEDRVHDLDRLAEITEGLMSDLLNNPEDLRCHELLATMVEILREKVRSFRATYIGWYHAPPTKESGE
jgi:hypothetical protein